MRSRVFVLGAGDCYEVCRPFLEQSFEILGLVETESTRSGALVGGYFICDLEGLANAEFDYLVIATLNEAAVKKSLAAVGFDMNKVLTLDQCPAVMEGLNARVFSEARAVALNKQYGVVAQGKKLRLLFSINSLGGGGAERSLITLLNQLDYDRYEVTLLLFVKRGIYLEQIPANVKLVSVFEEREDIISGMLVCKFATSEFLHRYFVRNEFDIEIAYLEGWAAKIIAGSQARRLCWIHCDLNEHHWTERCYGPRQCERDTYAKFDHLVFVARSAFDGFQNRFGKINIPVSVVQNIFDQSKICELAMEPVAPYDRFTFVSVGRMVAVKGFDRLIEAHAHLRHQGIEQQLILIGEGKEQESLALLARRLGVAESVKFLGFQTNPYRFVKGADVFVSSSFSEGSPLVVGESLILGTPVIATDCVGNREMLADGAYGLLVENSTQGLINGMWSMAVGGQLECYRKKAELAGSAFDANLIMKKVEWILHGDASVHDEVINVR